MFLELKVPPVAVTLIFGLGMWIVAAYTPALDIVTPWRFVLAIASFIAGGTVGFMAVVAFRRAGTTVNPLTPGETSFLVKTGIYRVSRNPMYLGLLFLLLGWAILLSNLLAFLFLPAFVAYMTRFQILPEERALSSNFGSVFTAYSRSVRRWL